MKGSRFSRAQPSMKMMLISGSGYVVSELPF